MSRLRIGGLLLCLTPILYASTPAAADWVPARWPWADVQSLELLDGSPVNCLLLKNYTAEFAAEAANRGLVTLAILTPGGDVIGAARRAWAAKVNGVVLDGDFPESAAAGVRDTAQGAPVIELTARSRIPLGSSAAILGTYQGVWPGVSVLENGAKRAGPSGSAWIDTNTGFIRTVRAWGAGALWIANQPPARTVITGERYLQAIADAAASGARWVLAFDPDFAARLKKRDGAAVRDWQRMNELLRYFEQHVEWRAMHEYGKLAIVQDPAKGGLLSGGILDMIAVKHTPVRPIPREHLTPEALTGATMAVNVDPGALTPEQQEVLRNFTKAGGMLLTAPPGWKDESPGGDRITLDKAELDRLNDIWREVNSMVGRRNLGVRFFNVSSMLSNVLISGDGKTEYIHLLNYSDYPVEAVTVYFLGDFKRATLLTPDGASKPLEIYHTEDSLGVDIDKVAVCGTIKLEQ